MSATLGLSCAMMLAVWGGCFFYVYWVRRVPLYHPSAIFLVYFFVGYVYRCFAIALKGSSDMWDFTGIPVDTDDVLYTTLVAVIGLLSFLIFPSLILKKNLNPAKIENVVVRVGRPSAFIIVLVGLGYLGFLALRTAFNVGLSDLEQLTAVETVIDAAGGRQLSEVSGYETAASGFLPAILVIYLYSQRSALLATLGFAGYVAFSLWVGTPRIGFVSATIALLILLMIRMGIGTPRLKHLLIIALCLGLFDVVGSNRAAIKQWAAGEIDFATVVNQYAYEKGDKLPLSDMHEYDSTSMIVHIVPDVAGYNFGTPYLRLFVWPIPRSWWPDKPVLTDRIVWLNYGNFINQTKSLIGMAYADLGIVSVIIALGLIGTMLNAIYNWASESKSPYAIVAFALATMFSPIIFRDGGVVFIYFIGIPFVGACVALWIGGPRLAKIAQSTALRIGMRVQTNR